MSEDGHLLRCLKPKSSTKNRECVGRPLSRMTACEKRKQDFSSEMVLRSVTGLLKLKPEAPSQFEFSNQVLVLLYCHSSSQLVNSFTPPPHPLSP
jgi:hypothetical protein